MASEKDVLELVSHEFMNFKCKFKFDEWSAERKLLNLNVYHVCIHATWL